MLSYQYRLTKKEDFEAVYRYGSFFSFGIIALKIKKTALSKSRFGLSIGLRFSKKATDRNKAKRQIRFFIQQNLTKIKPGFDIIIMLKKKPHQTISYVDLAKDFITLLKKEKIIIN